MSIYGGRMQKAHVARAVCEPYFAYIKDLFAIGNEREESPTDTRCTHPRWKWTRPPVDG